MNHPATNYQSCYDKLRMLHWSHE